jgi:hypothetical protein
MNGSSLASSAGILENGPSLRHRVSAHATPQEMTATVHQYPTGIRTCPRRGGRHPTVEMASGILGAGPQHECTGDAQRAWPFAYPVELRMGSYPELARPAVWSRPRG